LYLPNLGMRCTLPGTGNAYARHPQMPYSLFHCPSNEVR